MAVMDKKGGFYYGWVVLGAACAALFMTGGVRASFGVFLKPIIKDLAWERGTLALGVSVQNLVYGFSQPFIGRFADRHGPRKVLSVGIVLMALAAFSMTLITSPWQVYLLYGVLAGIGFGAAGPLANAVLAARWFARERGMVIGIGSAGLSAGQLVIIPLAGYLITLLGWRNAYFALAILLLAVLPLVFGLIRDHPQESLEHLEEEVTVARNGPPEMAHEDRTYTLSEALLTRPFWMLLLSFYANGFSIHLVLTHLAALASDRGFPEIAGAQALGLIGGVSVLGTMVVGSVSDRLGRRLPLASLYLIHALVYLFLLTQQSLAGLYTFAAIFGFALLATYPLTSALTADLYGSRSIGSIYGVISLAHQLGSASGAYLGGIIYDLTKSYDLALIVGAAVNFGALVCALSIGEKKGETSPAPS